MISFWFSLLAVSILSWRFPTELLNSCLLAFISSIVGVSVVSISDDSLANIGKVVAFSALATKIAFSLFTTEVFSTLAFGVTKKLLYRSLAPNCIFVQEAFNFWLACFFSAFVSFTTVFPAWLSFATSFCLSVSWTTFVSENALAPFIKKRTARPTEYFTFSYLLAIERKLFSVLLKLLFPIFNFPSSYLYYL